MYMYMYLACIQIYYQKPLMANDSMIYRGRRRSGILEHWRQTFITLEIAHV